MEKSTVGQEKNYLLRKKIIGSKARPKTRATIMIGLCVRVNRHERAQGGEKADRPGWGRERNEVS